MNCTIQIPQYCEKEFEYIIYIIFNRYYTDLHINIEYHDYSTVCILLPNNKNILLSTSFFATAKEKGLFSDYMIPKRHIDYETIFAPEGSIPVIFGTPTLIVEEDTIRSGIDVFGICFFMLTRLEEYIVLERDSHGRFPATASIAHKFGFLGRPIVDEYAEFLWNMMSHLDPSLTRQKREGKVVITCDVDWPFDPIRRSFKKTILSAGKSLLVRKKPNHSLQLTINYLSNKLKKPLNDAYRENISWMMDVNEKAGNRMHFYFITHCTSNLDSSTDFDSKEMRTLFREIHSRGHYIGLHPGYNTYNNAEYFSKSVQILKRVLNEEGIEQPELGGRQHFLMWDVRITPSLWEKNGMDYDSTLSYADKAGFRCGTCHEYSLFDVVNRRTLELKERPLIVMDCTVISARYEGLGYGEKTVERFEYFKEISFKYGGNFILLWHNTFFENEDGKKIYQNIIQGIEK